MNIIIQKIIAKLIAKQAFLKDSPKPGVVFVAIDSLFNDPETRKIVSKAVATSVKTINFDAVAGIASRGYLFSGMIVNQLGDKGEHFVQKVKLKGDKYFVQLDTTTEYSSDALQVLKNTIQPGKRYLLTDDLIATGGSAMTAINLIRKNGGQVDTLFVMTELTDLSARERLKKEGVELISLLKLTTQDLQNLLEIQNDYEANPSKPIAYQLSFHQKNPEITDQHYTMKRLIELNNKKFKKYAKSGIFFAPKLKMTASTPIDLYNHGCPVREWNIDPALVSHNSFKVFTTGDAFSVISPAMELSGQHVNIHVGIKHKKYSPLVLLQEAFQLCRCAYEHGANSITVALPDQYHPVAQYGDFNNLLIRLFKASGASRLYFYDKSYNGKLEDNCLKSEMPLTVSDNADDEHYLIARKNLHAYLRESVNTEPNLDLQVMHMMREQNFKRTWSKFNASQEDDDIMDAIGVTQSSPIKMPEIKNQTHVILCCTANKPLAEKIAESLRSRGEIVSVYASEGQGENAKIPDDARVCDAVVTIIQSTRPNPNRNDQSKEYETNGAASYLFEAMAIARQANLRGAKSVNLINPYQFSARSDKAEDNPKGKSGSYVQLNGMLLEAAGINHVITAECHDNHTMSGSYTGKNIRGTAISALSVIAARLANEWISDVEHPLQGQLRLVTPDAGAAKRTKELTEILQSILGNKLCKARVLGEKQRDSHLDISAVITGLNSGDININPHDKYVITDDETATGTTLCQAITNLTSRGAESISVIVVHNNMPLDWLTRQLCLARFMYLGVSDLHFSDTQEMGLLATSYDDLIDTYSKSEQLSKDEVEKKVFDWFKENISKNHSDQEFNRFKAIFKQLTKNIRIHSLAEEFANIVSTKPSVAATHDGLVIADKEVKYAANPTIPFFAIDKNKAVEIIGQNVGLSQKVSHK
jgi:adenine phosphoribosyltransferase